ncbi:MAG: hypothetical protein PVI06_01290 [Desulfobacterales bacterium]|jgi:hypothetical protein
MFSIKYINFFVLGVISVIAAAEAETAFARYEPVIGDSGLYPRHIIARIEIDMTPKDVKSVLGQPDTSSYLGHAKMIYDRLQIVFSGDNRVKEIQYHGRCGFVPLKRRGYNILNNPDSVRPFVIEALSRNDLLCPGHDFKRRIDECIAEVMDYVYGT